MSKTNKILADFAEIEPLRRSELEIYDPKANHNKFWRCYIYKPGDGYTYVVRHWGRNGTKGQQMAESFGWEHMGTETFRKLVDEKEDKGYRPEASTLDKIVREV
jgi:predicted DNA-binding WGR domain protein